MIPPGMGSRFAAVARIVSRADSSQRMCRLLMAPITRYSAAFANTVSGVVTKARIGRIHQRNWLLSSDRNEKYEMTPNRTSATPRSQRFAFGELDRWLNALSKLMKVPLEHEDAPVLLKYSSEEFRRLLQDFRDVRIVEERFPVKSRLHGGWKGTLFNTFFVGAFNALPRPLVRRFGWHLLAFCRK